MKATRPTCSRRTGVASVSDNLLKQLPANSSLLDFRTTLPHSGPLPLGAGESSAVTGAIPERGISRRLAIVRSVRKLSPSPSGRGIKGEGEPSGRQPRLALRFALVLFLFNLVASIPAAGQTVLDIANRRQLFLDDRFFASATNVELVVHPPRKTGERSIVPDKAWERGGIDNYSCVIEESGNYHLWYPSDGGLCYARSKDGITWEKPNLGLATFGGSRENNIVIGVGVAGFTNIISSEGMIFLDPNARKEERFRYATRVSDEYKHTAIFSSPDGIHWKLTHKKVLSFTRDDQRQHLDSQNVIFWDDRLNKYVAYMRRNQFQPGWRGRSVARSESATLDGFAEVQDSPIVLETDALDATLGGKPAVDYYTSGVIKYPWAQDAYFMFPQAYFHYMPGQLAEFPKAVPVNAGPLDTRFAASRDGVKWQRFDRRPYVPLGLKGDFDSKATRLFHGMVPSVNGREIYMYYVGGDQLHGWNRDEKNNRLLMDADLAPTQTNSLISRVVLRRDGFISARAAYAGGEFTTPVLKFSGKELALNVDTSAAGLLRCEFRDEAGNPIPGFTLADCGAIHTANEIDRVMKWRGQTDLSRFAGQPIKLHFVFRDTDLYAFQFR